MFKALTLSFYLLTIAVALHAQLIPDQEFHWFYEANCKSTPECEFYVSAKQDPILQKYSHDEFISQLNGLYKPMQIERAGQNRIIKLRLAFPIDEKPYILNAGIKDGTVHLNELEHLHDFIANWTIKPAVHRGENVSSICRLYIYWNNGIIERAIWRKALFRE